MAAGSIEITFEVKGDDDYAKGVSGLVLGNMVDPDTGKAWYGPINTNPWTWDNDGKNVTTYGLMANYVYGGKERTAFSQVVIAPGDMAEGSHSVKAVLETADIEGSSTNQILRFKTVTVDGDVSKAADVKEWGNGQQPSSNFA